MKKKVITVAFLSMLTAVTVSCQKENLFESQPVIVENGSFCNVRYSVDGVKYSITLNSGAEWDALVDSLFTLSVQGHDVRFAKGKANVILSFSKDTQTLITSSEEEAKAWSKERADEGYTVTITFNNGNFICIAYKK